jgi:nucleoside-diphosphate-sugar epimerase
LRSPDLRGARVLVTGGSGFIGSHLVNRVHQMGAEVHLLTRYNSVIDNVRLARIWDDLRVVEADLRNPDSVSRLRDSRFDYIFHFAAYNHVGDSFVHVIEAMSSNAMGTVNLVEACANYRAFVYVATSEVYGYQTETPWAETLTPFPISPYAVGKYSGELFARMAWHVRGLPIVVARPFNAFGPYQSPRAVIAEIILKCLRGETVEATEGVQTRDFNYVENLIDGLLLAATEPKAIGEIINIGSGIDIPIRELILKIHALTKSSSELKIGALPYRPTEIWRMAADSRKAAKLLEWKPRVGLDEGLELTVAWYRKFIDVYCRPDSPLMQL